MTILQRSAATDNIEMSSNPVYGVTTRIEKIEMSSNPVYGITTHTEIEMSSNPVYGVTNHISFATEDYEK